MLFAPAASRVSHVDRGLGRRPARANRTGGVLGPIIGAVVVLAVAVLAYRLISAQGQLGDAQKDVVEALNQWMPDVFPKYGAKASPFDKVSHVSFTNASLFGAPEQLTFEHWYMHSGGALKDRAGLVKGTYNRVTRDIDMTCTFQENRGVVTVKARMPDFRGTRASAPSGQTTAPAAGPPAASPTAPAPAAPAKVN